MKSSTFTTGLAGLALAAMTACSTMAPTYTPHPDNINRLRDAGLETAKVGEFTGAPGVGPMTIRGASYNSPYESSFIAYLKEALRLELEQARLLNPASQVELTGILLKNELNAAGFSKADAMIEARFVVKRDGQVKFDKVITAKYEWESSFAGAVAIPRAVANYPATVQMLLTNLYSDAAFIAAMKK
jgi:hypothetical protein